MPHAGFCRLALICTIPLVAAPVRRPYTVENYEVSIGLDLANQRLSGEANLRIRSAADTPLSALELDVGSGLQVASVAAGGSPQYFERNGNTLAIALTPPLRPAEVRILTVRYQAGPAAGLKFFPDQVYTTAASDWAPCDERPGERSTLLLRVAAREDLKVAASGQLAGPPAVTGGRANTVWQLDVPVAAASFGFAAGSFAESTREAEGVKLRVLGAGPQVFDPTAAALRFLDERTGKRYAGQSYTQVFVHGDTAHALAGGVALLPESKAEGFGESADSLRLLTSLMARQWYGITVGFKDWGELWLSEGVSAFVADALVGERMGKAAYDRQIEDSRKIYDRLRGEDKDRALSYLDWKTREEAGGELPEHKGVCFLYLAQALMGESGLWRALRIYTNDQWGAAADSEDLQRAFDSVGVASRNTAGKSAETRRGASAKKSGAGPLDTLFDNWVWGIATNGK